MKVRPLEGQKFLMAHFAIKMLIGLKLEAQLILRAQLSPMKSPQNFTEPRKRKYGATKVRKRVSPRQVLKSLRGLVTEKFENFSSERMSFEGHFY
jgi:hypothetical protein